MIREKESGQSIIVIAGVAIVLLALVALVVDVGNAYAHRRLVQNAVDAAALAGARRLAERGIGQTVLEIQVLNDVEDFADINGVERDAVQAWFIDADGIRLETVDPWLGPAPGDAEGVEVEGDLPFNTYIAGFLGFPSMMATTTAKAWVLTGPCSAQNLFPLTVSTGTFTETAGIPAFGHIYTLWDQNHPSSPGNWGWLYWEDDQGICHCPDEDECCPQTAAARNLEENILDNSRSGIWQVDDWIHGGSGIMIGGVLDRLFPYAGPNGPDIVIPLYDDIRGTGDNTEYHISGFAAFRLRCVYASKHHYAERSGGECAPCAASARSSDKCIRGEFVKMVVPSGQDGCDDTGIYIPSFRKPRQ